MSVLKELVERLGLLAEASIARLFGHLRQGHEFAILTGWTLRIPEPPPGAPEDWLPPCDEIERPSSPNNRKRNRFLSRDLQRAGFSFVRTRGPWDYECRDHRSGEVKTIHVDEPGFTVYRIAAESALAFGRIYGQQSVIWGRIGEGVWEFYTDGRESRWLGSEPTVQNIGRAFTQIRGHRFTFTGAQPVGTELPEVGVEGQPGSWGETLELDVSFLEALRRFSPLKIEEVRLIVWSVQEGNLSLDEAEKMLRG